MNINFIEAVIPCEDQDESWDESWDESQDVQELSSSVAPECLNAYWELVFVGIIADQMIPTEYVEPGLPF